MDKGKQTFGWFDSSDFFFCSFRSVLSPLLPLSLSLARPAPLDIVLSVSLLKPKCCCEGREPWKAERPCGRWAEQGSPDPPRRGRHSSDATLGPGASAFFFVSLLPPGKWNCWAGPWRQQRLGCFGDLGVSAPQHWHLWDLACRRPSLARM